MAGKIVSDDAGFHIRDHYIQTVTPCARQVEE
jgi:hypothetical protein